jgi:putative DNA primase/helicase
MSEDFSTASEQAAPSITESQPNTQLDPSEAANIRRMIFDRQAFVEDLATNRNTANRAKSNIASTNEEHRLKTELRSSELSWRKSEPIIPCMLPQTYPTDALPTVIREAVLEVQQITQAPMALPASAAICAMATASQGLIDVSRAEQLSGPASLFFLVLGDSGERKSTVDAFFSRPLREFQQRATEKGKPDMSAYRAEFDSWTAKIEGIKSAIKNALRGKPKSNPEDFEKLLRVLYDSPPKRRLVPNVLVVDITTEKLAHQLANEWPSCALISAEGGLVFGGRSFSKDNQLATLALFNALWSDEPFRVSRKTCESFEIRRARMSLSLFVQSQVFDRYIADNDITRTVGFLGRCLFAFPESTQGCRPYKDQPKHLPALEKFSSCVAQLLDINLSIESGVLTLSRIPLTPAAKILWIDFHDNIERQLGIGGKFASVRDFGSKAAENAARLAVVFQASKGFPIVEVDNESMESGCRIAAWHLNEAARFFGTDSSTQNKTAKNAALLETWLITECQRSGKFGVERSYAMQRGPNPVRPKEQLQAAIALLQDRHRARQSQNGRIIEINPELMGHNS